MKCVAGGETAEYVYTARRNNSLSSSGRWLVFGFMLAVSLGIAAVFSIVAGAWPIMPFAGLEMAVLFFAFRYMDRHAADYECITIRGGSIAVEVREGTHVNRLELSRYWAKIVCGEDRARLALPRHRSRAPLVRRAAACDGSRARARAAAQVNRPNNQTHR
jgi:uncharacterized membrane protein